MIHVIRNEDIQKVLLGTPKDHKHLRVCIKMKDNSFIIFQEATIANILRSYMTIKTHPTIRAQQLELKRLTSKELKKDYATHQLLEVPRDPEEIEDEIKDLLEKSHHTLDM